MADHNDPLRHQHDKRPSDRSAEEEQRNIKTTRSGMNPEPGQQKPGESRDERRGERGSQPGGSRTSGQYTGSMGPESSEEARRTSAGGRQLMLSAIFRDRESAERAYHVTLERGYDPDEVNIVMSQDTREKYFSESGEEETEMGNKALEGTGAGSAIGGGLGAAAGIIAAVGTSIAIPGLGIVIAGPIAAGLAGAGAGGIAGGIIGALIGAGIPEEKAKTYESGIREGNIVLTVRPHNEQDAQYLEREWRANQGEEIHRSLESA